MTIIPNDLAIYQPKKELVSLLEKNQIEENILAEIDSDFHTISIVENEIGRFLKYDDTYQAGYINTSFYQGNLPYINYFLIPCLMNKEIKNILLVGFGSGILINQYEKVLNNLENIDVVDIEENIFQIATDYFDFKKSSKTNFHLQDALIYLKTTKKKYDLIVVDVAGDEGIDERFCDSEYLSLIKKHLKKDGIFVSNMPSSRDIFNKKNTFVLELLECYKDNFKNIDIYNGKTSNKIFYKTFYSLDEIVYDVTNLILISSDKRYEISKDFEIIDFVDLKNYINDKVYAR
ncbi:MAG: fused MFS/spermidine synthase [Candidatus Gastranaerophilales bacterium]|nr:fused MFS/spermidine synthase [Candidatus Gastranaerophilales bacterium]